MHCRARRRGTLPAPRLTSATCSNMAVRLRVSSTMAPHRLRSTTPHHRLSSTVLLQQHHSSSMPMHQMRTVDWKALHQRIACRAALCRSRFAPALFGCLTSPQSLLIAIACIHVTFSFPGTDQLVYHNLPCASLSVLHAFDTMSRCCSQLGSCTGV